MAEKERIPAGTIILGVAGLGLILWGMTRIGGPKASSINARFTFDYVGPATDVKFRVRFGDVGLGGLFAANADLVKLSETFHIDQQDVPRPIEFTVKVIIPTKSNPLFHLPHTYSGEAMILDLDGNVIDKVITTNVFTEDENYGVTML